MQSTTTHPTHTPVLIVGGSLVGLSAALFLAWRGVPVMLVEKHLGSATHPRATGFTERTLEIFRTVGIADQVPQVAPGTRLRRVRADALAGAWHAESAWTPGEQAERSGTVSPCTGAAIAQDRLEPILRAAAIGHGADLRLGVEMLAFEADEGGVTAHVRLRDGGAVTVIRADYIIAADGADSPIRTALGIARQGVGHLRTLRSVLFRCPAADAWLAHGVQQFEIAQPGFNAFLTTYGDSRWVLMFDDDRERSADELAHAVRRALGEDLPFDVLATGCWELAGSIAERYRQGRIFLAGDAAHQLPPTRGGFGANTGIDDAWNLAWKLQWVVNGASHARLLDSYDAERRPVGWLRHQQTFARPDYARWVDRALQGEPLYGSVALELGQLLRSDAVIGAGAALPPAAHPDEWAGQPGTRAPHLWLRAGTRTLSTLDLFGQGFVLLTGDRHWAEAADLVARTLPAGMPGALRAVLVGTDVELAPGVSLEQRFGIGADGATLMRPDGIVAWRSPGMAADPAACLAAALAQVAALVQETDE